MARLLFIHVAAVANPDDKDQHGAVLDIGDDPIIADASFPEAAHFAALQRLAEAARVIESGGPFREEFEDASGGLLIELSQVILRETRKLNPPGHTASSRLRAVRSCYGRRELR